MTEQVLKNLGIKALNEMQLAALPVAGEGKDLVLLSPTGSGKTLAFLLPVAAKLRAEEKGVQALVLVPSRELAIQIEKVFRSMGTGFKVNCCYGGHLVKTEKNNLEHPPALLIGTPGRIAHHIRKHNFDPSSIRLLVLDEFDKSLEFGFQDDMSFITGKLENLRQNVLTSATDIDRLPPFVKLENPVTLNFLKDEKPSGLALKLVTSPAADKLQALVSLICKVGDQPTLIFCNHREAVDRISESLEAAGVVHEVFHGGMDQEDRERSLIKFRNGSNRILVTTDLASRGLDIPEIQSVIHYQLPPHESSFIHRNGRTARMHATGSAYLISGETETLPAYIDASIPKEPLGDSNALPPEPIWRTLYIGAGKKDKINKVDIVGLLMQKGELKKEELGLIEVLDNVSYAAVSAGKINALLRRIKDEKIKKKSVKIQVSR